MGRTVYVEERLHGYLSSISRPDGYTTGLILGQSFDQKDYVIHLAKTPPPQMKNVVEETLISSSNPSQVNSDKEPITSVNDIPAIWVADHARHVTKMLPGGMFVLGIFIVGPSDTLSDNKNVQKFRSILNELQKSLAWNKYLCGYSSTEYLILSVNSISNKYVCKSVDINGDGILRPADWKFQAKATKWHQLETVVQLNKLFLVEVDKNPEVLRQQLQNIMKDISETVESALVVIEGEVSPLDSPLDALVKPKKDRGDRETDSDSNVPLEVSMYIPCATKEESDEDVHIKSCSASMRLVGRLVSKTFVHSKAIVAEAITAIKQDVVRSLASRFEMHWDSLIEEESGSPEDYITLHEPPRRVLVNLPQSVITLSDYLFPGEGPQEALLSLQELLDLEVGETDVQKEIELQADPTEFYCQNEAEPAPVEVKTNERESRQMAIYFTGVGVALLILIAAIIMHQMV